MFFYHPALLMGAVFAFWLVGYQSTWLAMASIWERSETFAHGYLILPISLFLLWRNRGKWQHLKPKQDPWALLPLVGAGLLWYVTSAIEVQVVSQLMAVVILQAAIWLMLGRQIIKAILFPLLYLFFAVPMGEGLIEPMMLLTAKFVILAVKATGIPIFYEGTFFSLPSGDWSVVEGCSGVRYLIASLALGCLYAYLTYQKLHKRLIFIFLAAVVPIVANWIRAFAIVMLGHFSGMKLATGVDHLVYGWFFFGLVIFLMFSVGHFWRDPEPDLSNQKTNKSGGAYQVGSWKASVMTLVGLLLWPSAAYTLALLEGSASWQTRLPNVTNWRSEPSVSTSWQPRYLEPSAQERIQYSSEEGKVGLHLMLYLPEGKELFSSYNQLVRQKDPVWREVALEALRPVKDLPFQVDESLLSSADQELLVWHWQDVNGHKVTNLYQGKAWEAWFKVTGRSFAGTGVMLYTEIDSDRQRARERLSRFVETWHLQDPDFSVAIQGG
jgi:exosortase A